MSTTNPNTNASIFLVYGSDDLSARQKADEITARLCPPAEQDFGLEVLSPEADIQSDAAAQFLRNVREALLTPPFLGGNKTVYVKGAPFFNPNSDLGRLAPVKAEVEHLANLLKKGLPPGVRLVLLTPSVNKITSFYKTFQKLGAVHAFDQPEREREAKADLIPRIRQLLKDNHISMTSDVLDIFLDHTGYSYRHIASEIEKLSLYLGSRTQCSRDDIYLMVAPVRAGQFWEFADAFCSGNLDKTLRILHRLTGQGEQLVGLIISLENRLRDILVLSDCLARKWARLSGGDWPRLNWDVPPEGETLLAQLEKDPRKANPTAAGMMAAQAARLSPARWQRYLNAAVDCHADITGAQSLDPLVAAELFITRTLGELRPR